MFASIFTAEVKLFNFMALFVFERIELYISLLFSVYPWEFFSFINISLFLLIDINIILFKLMDMNHIRRIIFIPPIAHN